MGSATAWLERSLQNCSLNHTHNSNPSSSSSPSSDHSHPLSCCITSSSSSSSSCNIPNYINDDVHGGLLVDIIPAADSSSSDDNSGLIDLHSHVSLPSHWEQCLDLKTGELYYINWSTGMKAKQDPRSLTSGYTADYSSDEATPYYDSHASTTDSSSCSSNRESCTSANSSIRHQQVMRQDTILVVAGCKSCLMYYMLPKHVPYCPKCCGQLLHFVANNDPSP